MTVEKLIEEYSKAQKIKRDYNFSKHLRRSYVPHLEKISAMESVVKRCSYDEIEGETVYNRHTPTLFFTFTMRMIALYTDIEIENPIQDYDALAEAQLLKALISIIPESEYTLCEKIMQMIRNDIEFNTRDLVPFLESKIKALGIGADTILSTMSNPDVIAKITKQLEAK